MSRKNRFVDNLMETYNKGRHKGYEEGVFATHAVWITTIKDTPGIGPKTQEKLLAAARAMMAERLEKRGNLSE